MPKAIHLQIPATDGFLLGAVLFTKQEADSKGLIILHEGTALPQKRYLPYAHYLAEQGYDALCFDYRGVGKSMPKQLKGFEASIIDWAKKDMKGVIHWACHHYSSHKKYIIAHSMGGQVLGLVDNINQIDKIVTIASSYGNWRNYNGWFRLQGAFFWAVLLPVFTKLYGYFPAKKLGLGSDWPKGVAQNWFDWCKSNKPLSTLMDESLIDHGFHNFQVPIKAYVMADDHMATTKTIPLYRHDFSSTHLEVEVLHPKDYGLAEIGHFGFYLKKNKDLFWHKPLDFLEQ